MHPDSFSPETLESVPTPEQETSPAAAPRSWRRGARTFARELLQTVVLMLVLFLGVRGLAQNFRVEGPSIKPTLTSGEFLWVNKAAYFEVNGQYWLGGPQRGDIAVLRSPDPAEEIDLIKRVIGLPGDRLRVKRGEVFINDQPLTEPYIRFQASYTYPFDGADVVVPAGEYFVLGDN